MEGWKHTIVPGERRNLLPDSGEALGTGTTRAEGDGDDCYA